MKLIRYLHHFEHDMSVSLDELLSERRGICSFRQNQYIRHSLEHYASHLDELDAPRITPLLYLASKFGISSRGIARLAGILSPRVDLYSIVYRKRYETHELVPQQYVTAIRERLHGVTLRELRDVPVEIHLLAGTVVGFAFENGISWRGGERVVFASEMI